jgi:multidrug efflux pump subunit AcrB
MTTAPVPDEVPGLAGRLARTFIRSPLSPLILLTMLALGVLGLLLAPRQEDPQISVPLVDIFLQFPGAAAEEAARLAVEPLERLMSEIPGVKHVYSRSTRGQGVVTVRFEVGEAMGPSIVKVYQKVMANMDELPPGVRPPLIQRKGVDDVPILDLTLWSESVDDEHLRELGLNLLQALKQVPDTGEGFVVGGRQRHLKVRVHPAQLSAYDLTLQQIAGAMQAANQSRDTGAADDHGVHFQLFAAFALTPWLALRLRPALHALEHRRRGEERMRERLTGVFARSLGPLLERRTLGLGFLGVLATGLVLSLGLFVIRAVVVKMLPYDNKPELEVMVDLPAGTALPVTANATRAMVEALRELPEVTAVQVYDGTPAPFDFNGMVRHYYLRQQPWQAQIHVQLVDKHERSHPSHAIAQSVRPLLAPIAKRFEARLTVAELPPGPPVLQTLVAEVYGPTRGTLRQVAGHLEQVFEDTPGVADVNASMRRLYPVWRFQVDAYKAERRGVSVQDILRNLSLAMGSEHSADIKQGPSLEPTWIVIGVPYADRADPNRLADLPIPSTLGGTVPLRELGRFEPMHQEAAIYHKDLRSLEHVVGDAAGRLDSPTYPMAQIGTALDGYRTPDGVTLSGTLTGPPPADGRSAFQWGGEWTVTYETFRDLGLAFAASLLLIYLLLVMEFRDFRIPLIIMAPIPMTLLGIVPGHWLLGAEFTATSMIGFIALAGIIVRNSILLVDFALHELGRGVPLQEALLAACQTRTRPILITALALVGGSAVILTDPIFQGMAVSLLFGVLASTLLTLVVVPLGCLSVGGAMRTCRRHPGGGAALG